MVTNQEVIGKALYVVGYDLQGFTSELSMTNRTPFSILVVEANPDNHLLVDYSCKKNGFHVNPVFVTNSSAALSYLEDNATSESLCPKLILMDLSLPDPDKGLLLLEQVKKLYPRLPVIIMGSQRTDYSIQQVYNIGANSFISKPDTLCGWESHFRVLLPYWFNVVTLPPAIH